MVFEMETCGACRTCEMICCFHHTGKFGPSPTSFRVSDNPEGKGFLIVIAEKSEGMFVPCDHCVGLETPLCVEVCQEAEVLMGFLREHQKAIKKSPSLR